MANQKINPIPFVPDPQSTFSSDFRLPSPLLRPRFDTKQLPKRLAGLHLKPRLLDHLIDLRFTKEIHWAAADILQTHLSNGHPPCPVTRPGAQELAGREFSNQAQPFRRLHDLSPEPDGEGG